MYNYEQLIKDKYYYSFKDVLAYFRVTNASPYCKLDITTYDDTPMAKLGIRGTDLILTSEYLIRVINTLGGANDYFRYEYTFFTISFSSMTAPGTITYKCDYAQEILAKVINKYGNWIAFISDEDYTQHIGDTSAKYINPVIDKVTRILNKVEETYKRYTLLLDLYKNKQDEIIASLGDVESIDTESKGQNSFNDTPQVAEGTNDYTGDGYMSNLTISKGEGSTTRTFYANVIDRLNSIRKEYKDLMDMWVNEFADLFIPLSNYR